MNLTEILEYSLFDVGSYTLTIGNLLFALIILLGSRMLLGFIYRTFLNRFFTRRNIDGGRQFAIKAFIKYIIYTIALLWAMQTVGIQLSVLWGGAAALLVGIGLGLQQTFNDLISGIILLTEATVAVGDVVSVGGIIGTVTNIGIRTSKVETRDAISIIIPNSKLVVDNVINWSHNRTPTRFQVAVGVAYSSDIKLVSSLLLEAVEDHVEVLKVPAPRVQFKDFGNSSLDFEINFFTVEYLGVEQVKSNIRFRIMELFREHNIEIPFPQRDLWLKNAPFLTQQGHDQHAEAE
ncbi:MAG: mechanosensitive ion channel protein MscS [Saprospiraceae bacterium]|nr:MAG: mechanosensitive ion channel protein MscS [Saprospiraceae bacterium]